MPPPWGKTKKDTNRTIWRLQEIKDVNMPLPAASSINVDAAAHSSVYTPNRKGRSQLDKDQENRFKTKGREPPAGLGQCNQWGQACWRGTEPPAKGPVRQGMGSQREPGGRC